MSRSTRYMLIVAAGLFVLNVKATAETITFNSIPIGSGLYNSVDDSGFDISSVQAFFLSSGASFCYPQCPENGTHYLMTQWEYGSGTVFISAINGSSFRLTSFQYAEKHIGTPYSPNVYVVGHLSDGGTVSTSFLLDGINDGAGSLIDFQTAILPPTFQSLTSVEFKADYSYTISLDNIVVTPVPLPPSLMLLISGLGALFSLPRLTHGSSGSA